MKYPTEIPREQIQQLIKNCTFVIVELFGVKHMCCAVELHSGFIVTSEFLTSVDKETPNEELLKELTWLNTMNRLTHHEYYRQFAELNGVTAHD